MPLRMFIFGRAKLLIFGHNRVTHIEPGGLGDGEQENGTLKPSGFRAADTTMLVLSPAGARSSALAPRGARGLDFLVDLAGSKLVGALALGFLPDQPEHFPFRGCKPHVVPDAQEDR